MKRICFINSVKTWGGGEKWHFEASTYMHKKGYDVLVITNKKSELYNKLKNTNITSVGIKINNFSFLNPFKINTLKKILKQHNIDTIVINLSEDLKLGGLASKRAGVKKIIYRRGSAIPIKNSFLNRYYFKNIVTDIIANSEATKRTVLENNNKLFPIEKIKVIYNAIDCKKHSKTSPPYYQKTDNNHIRIISLGRLEYEKNHKFLIYLSKELKERNIKHKILVGGEGSLKESLIEQSKKLKVDKEISFLGFIDNPKELLQSADIFIHPSLWEGFGYVLAEASLYKKPVIAFNTTSIPEIIVHKKSGFVVEPNNIKKVANVIELLASNKKLRDDLGLYGHNFVTENFDSSIIYKQMEDYLIS